MEYYIGQIVLFAGNFAPRCFMTCSGQLLPIEQNSALFSILGTTYGGDGITTFALPNLNGRSAAHAGQGPGLSEVVLGEEYGNATATLTSANLPAGALRLMASPNAATTTNPSNAVLAAPSFNLYNEGANGLMAPCITPGGGGNQPMSVQPPSLVLNYIICTEGIYPSRG